MNETDQDANTKAMDSLLNFETVKYFGNEPHEARRYDASLARYERAYVRSEVHAEHAERRPGGGHRPRPDGGDADGGQRRRATAR